VSAVRKQSRREVIKTFTLLTASSALLGRNWVATVLAQVGPSATTGGVMKLKISDYPPLKQINGSVRIGTSLLQGPSSCLGPRGLFPPVLINRGPDNQFYALKADCTHAGCTVPVYNSGLGYSQCPHEGSRFGIDGRLLRGPAGFPLYALVASFDGADSLTVENQDWSIELTTLGVLQGASGRFSLRFLAFRNIEYEVHFREPLSGSDSTVNFSLTPGGPADQNFLWGTDDFETVYVERQGPSGFYQIAMKVSEV